MNCTACGWDKSTVLRTETWPEWRIRKRQCLRCKYEFTTWEMQADLLALLQAANYVYKQVDDVKFKDFLK